MRANHRTTTHICTCEPCGSAIEDKKERANTREREKRRSQPDRIQRRREEIERERESRTDPEKGGGLSHQGRNTRTRWYGKPIIIVFTQQQRAAIKNCLFIQARLFSIRPRTSTGSRAGVRACVRVRASGARTTRRDFSAYQTVVSNFPPVRRFPACVGPGRRKKLPVTSAIAGG